MEKIVKVGLHKIEKWGTNLEAQVKNYEARGDEKGQIVFYGPSNFTRWRAKYGAKPLEEEIIGKSGKPCGINRGFGSSGAEHHLYYYPRMVRAMEPSALVYAPGLGNSLSFGYTHEEVFSLAARVVAYARTDFPDMPIYICGFNVRREPDEKTREYIEWLRELANETENCRFIDVAAYEPLHRDDIFAEDGKHFNALGYSIYAEMFRKELVDELEKL